MKPLVIRESPRKEVRGIMTVICAWCGIEKEKGDPKLPVSHGMCETCEKVETEKMDLEPSQSK